MMAVAIPGVHYHIGVVTRDLDEGMVAVGGLLGLTWVESEGVADIPMATLVGPVDWRVHRVAHSTGGPMRIELLEGGPGSVWETRATAELHHIAYWVDDVAGTVALLQADGWSCEVTDRDNDARPMGFAYMTKPGNARVELGTSANRDATLARLGWDQWADHLR
jgi:hypothetical protein